MQPGPVCKREKERGTWRGAEHELDAESRAALATLSPTLWMTNVEYPVTLMQGPISAPD